MSCRNESDKLMGHWHSVPNNSGEYYTLDFNDSLQTLNKLGTIGLKEEFKRVEGEVFLYPLTFEPTSDYQISNDTLTIDGQYKFVRIVEDLKMGDYYSSSRIAINLKQSTTMSLPIESLNNKRLSPILVGPAKKTLDDSVYMEVNDVFIEKVDLIEYAHREHDKWYGAKFNMVIHADSMASKRRIEDIIAIVEPLDCIDNILISSYNYEMDRMEFDKIETDGNISYE